MKILVTGSSGHLGEAIVRTLIRKGIEYVGVDIKAGPFTTIVGSLVDKEFVDEIMRGVDHVIHTATLHKPHVATHSKQDFVDTNVTATLHLLEAALENGIQSFIFTSTTSAFGETLRPTAGAPAVWVTEDSPSIPKNIYGATKIAAEDLCYLFHRNHGLPCLILRTSRFFPEEDDNAGLSKTYSNENNKVNEFLYRRVDVQDAVDAHLLAIEKAVNIGFAKYIISASTVLDKADLVDLRKDAPTVIARYFPQYPAIYAQKNWKMYPSLDRVYINEKAKRELGWQPKYDYQYVLDCLAEGRDFRSPLTLQIGKKGYHDQEFEEGPYPVNE